MKILLVSDLHYVLPWYEWIFHLSSEYDLIAIAGDLLDMEHQTEKPQQVQQLLRWFTRCEQEGGRPMAVCSGNHDDNSDGNLWLYHLHRPPKIFGDSRTHLIQTPSGAIAVTTLTYNFILDQGMIGTTRSILQEGSQLKRQHRIPWLIISHEPPAGTSLSGDRDERSGSALRKLIVQFQPDYLFCGHFHRAAEQRGHGTRLGQTICLAAGCSEELNDKRARPNHVILDTEQRITTWHHGSKMVFQKKHWWPA